MAHAGPMQAHKARAGAGKSARQKHREKRDVVGRPVSTASVRGARGKSERLNAAKQQRDKKRAELLQSRRKAAPPRVVALLPLSDAVDAQRLWDDLLGACRTPISADVANAGGMEVEADSCEAPLAMQTVAAADRRQLAFTFLPPPEARDDPLAIVELGRAADVVLLAVPGDERQEAIDEQGLMALAVLRALGLPTVVGVVQLEGGPSSGGKGGGNAMKARSAAKKRGAAALQEQVPGEYKVLLSDSVADMQQVVRHLADTHPSPPLWRQQRPSVLIEGADFQPSSADPGLGTLLLRGYVRNLGLSVNQAIHIPLIGDFLLERLAALEPPSAAGRQQRQAAQQAQARQVLAELMPDPLHQESLQRENVPDPLAGEQTWPTQEELMDAEAARRSTAARKRRLPPGTSDYQAAWILDDDDEEEDEEEGLSGEEGSDAGGSQGMADASPPPSEGGDLDFDGVDTATEIGMDVEDDEDPADMLEAIKARRQAAADDVQFPDEVEVPPDQPARQRFAKYRGLKSFRTSPWDPKESLPLDYARVFAFERPRRTEKRAKEAARAAGGEGDEHGLPAGSYAQLAVGGVPADAAARVCAAVAAACGSAAPPVVAFGLLQHECKLSVVNFGVRKVAAVEEPVAAKEPLLLVSGLRSFPARPVYSSDEHGADKHKMERFLHEGRSAVATVYAPISYGPLPLLAFKPSPGGGRLALVATGSLRSCDPDRIVVKKIVLAGFPVKVHKAKAVVRFMFHSPDDIRWFRPVDLWTKHGRRGRISEPVGTHGAMKCVFDGPLKQQDSVCMSLYKRTFPVWPESMAFTAV
eukprot:scaffold2.g6809.t1